MLSWSMCINSWSKIKFEAKYLLEIRERRPSSKEKLLHQEIKMPTHEKPHDLFQFNCFIKYRTNDRHNIFADYVLLISVFRVENTTEIYKYKRRLIWNRYQFFYITLLCRLKWANSRSMSGHNTEKFSICSLY